MSQGRVAIAYNSPTRKPQRRKPYQGVVKRNWIALRGRIAEAILGLVVEPMVYFLALGYGLGSWTNLAEGQAYHEFLFPAILALATIAASFHEAGSVAWQRLHNTDAYRIMRLSPLRDDDIAKGEWIWATIKGAGAGIALTFVGAALGLLHSWVALFTLPVLILIAALSAGTGLLAASFIDKPNHLSWIYSLLIMPLFLGSETFVPIAPHWSPFSYALWASPIFHVMRVVRPLWEAQLEWGVLGHFAGLALITAFVVPYGIRRFATRLQVEVPQ